MYDKAYADKVRANSPRLRVWWVDRDTLIQKLEDSHFLYVIVDSTRRSRRDFIEELRADEKKGE